MKNARWFLAAFTAGFLLALAPSCTPAKPRCTASNCNGCCDANGTCQPGDNGTACGRNGGACSPCAPNQTCQLGFCTQTGNTTCTSTSCPNGQTCENGVCTGSSGDGGTCGPSNCAGCCRNGQCVTPSNSALSCGASGSACQTCTGSQVCQNGQCLDVGGGSCNSSNCPSGCCSGTQCIQPSQQTSSQCGFGGAVCLACSGTNVCSNGTCVAASGCDSQNCPTGCCSGSGSSATCLLGTTDTSCGAGGNACQVCNTGAGQTCINQMCQGAPPPAASVGSACSNNTQCAVLGGNYTCKLSTSSGNATYSGGYCTRLCTQPADCPLGSTCVALNPAYGEADTFCWDNCSTTDLCRSSGYACYQVGSSTACWVSPLPTPDAGPPFPPGEAGSACTANADCMPPNDGECVPQVLPDGGATGYPGGACTAPCDLDPQNHCGDGGICIDYGTSGAWCEGACTGPLQGQSNCRTGYVCSPLTTPDGGLYPLGFCRPRCDNVGAYIPPCGSGFTCQTSGARSGYCCDAALMTCF